MDPSSWVCNLKLIAWTLKRKCVDVSRIISIVEEMMTLLQTEQLSNRDARTEAVRKSISEF